MLLVSAVVCTPVIAQERTPVDDRYKWSLAEIYPSEDAWEKARLELVGDIGKLAAMHRPQFESAAGLLAALALRDRIGERASRVAVYARMRYDLDTRVGRSQQMSQQARETMVAYRTAGAWIRSAIVATGPAKVRRFIRDDPRLAPYRHPLENALRFAAHTLDAQSEKLLAETGLIQDAGEAVFSVFTNADLPWPTVTLSDGSQVLLDASLYEKYRESANRDDRTRVFRAFFTTYGKFTRTLGTTLDAQVRSHAFERTARKYESSLQAALFEDNIPPGVYSQLIRDAHRQLPTLHRYLRLRQRMLGIDHLRYEDLYVPIIGDYPRTFTPEEATSLVVRAVAPLGAEYRSVLESGLHAKWTDWYPATGKRSGAYSTMVYGLHPFQLQNFTGRYGEVSTLAHESGHSMHSYLAARTQPFVTWRYPTFIAEVASTLNENLLVNAMLEQAKTDDERLFLLGSELELLRTTLFRQVLFAEFELRIHESVESGKPLTGDNLKALYLGLLRTYYGHDEGVCEVDELYANEWAYIPHFYFDFYVYQYATSVIASTTLAQGIRSEATAASGATPQRDRYLRMLGAGGSRYAYDMLKEAGVDLATSAPFDAAMREMNGVMDRIEAIVARRTIPAATGTSPASDQHGASGGKS